MIVILFINLKSIISNQSIFNFYIEKEDNIFFFEL